MPMKRPAPKRALLQALSSNIEGTALWQTERMPVLQPCLPPVPILETARLQLRAHTEADLPAMVRMWADPVVVRYLGCTPQSSQETWIRYLRHLGQWAHFGYGYWAVEERATGRFVGEAGFADYDRLTMPQVALAPEIGWVPAAKAHGKGYATEAAQAMLAWGATAFGKARTGRCLIEQGHTASRHVALKCGFLDFALVEHRNSPAWILELQRL